MAGGAGYVLSKESLTRFVKKGIYENHCPEATTNEDLALGTCLKSLEVLSGDGRDEYSRERFFQFPPNVALIPEKPEYFPGDYFEHYSFIWYDYKFGQKSCCSDTFISSHQITAQEMYLYEYLTQTVTVYGKYDQKEELPRKISFDEIQQKFDGNVVNNDIIISRSL